MDLPLLFSYVGRPEGLRRFACFVGSSEAPPSAEALVPPPEMRDGNHNLNPVWKMRSMIPFGSKLRKLLD